MALAEGGVGLQFRPGQAAPRRERLHPLYAFQAFTFGGAIASVVLPELVVAKRWHHALHNQRALFLKRLLLFEHHVVLSSVPHKLH